MKLLSGLLILVLLGIAPMVRAADQEARAGLLLTQISDALKNDNASTALSYCATLEKIGPTLKKPLPVIFYFYYIDALQRSGLKGMALSRARTFLTRFGQDTAHSAEVRTLLDKLENEARDAGEGKDAIAAVEVWEEALRIQQADEHKQALQVLRSCQGEAIALERVEKDLDLAAELLNAQGNALQVLKGALDQRMTRIDRSGGRSAEEEKQIRLDFNRDSQAYNGEVASFNAARDHYLARVDDVAGRRLGYVKRCGNLSVVKEEVDEVCAGSNDEFCRGFE